MSVWRTGLAAWVVLGGFGGSVGACGEDRQGAGSELAVEPDAPGADADDAALQHDSEATEDATEVDADVAVQHDADAAPPEDTAAPPSDTAVPADVALPPDGGPIVTLPDAAGDTTGSALAPLGGERPAEVYLPEGYDPATPAPLVILLHGYSATGTIQDLYFDFHAQATAAGFIAVVPDGTTNSFGLNFWNADPAWCCNYEHSAVDDAAYLLGLIAEARERFAVAPDRVYLLGHSNGAFMAYAMACRHADTIAGVVTLAGSMALDPAHCAPSRPVSVLHAHGSLDAVIPYLGSAFQFPGAAETVDRWLGHDSCANTPVTTFGYDYDAAVFGFESTRALWDDCAGGAQVSHWVLYGSTHVPVLTPRFLEDAFAFLLSHARTAP